MQTLILDETDLGQIVARIGIDRFMDLMIDRLAVGFREFDDTQTEIPARSGFHYDDPTGLIEWMPLHQRGDKVLMKLVGYHPASPARRGMPTIVSTLSSYDTQTGHLIAIVDGTLLTAVRTGAASAVASQWMADPDSKTLGLVGCGAQAVTQLHAISRVFDLKDVYIFDVDDDALRSFAARVAGVIDSPAITVKSVDEIASDSDIICTTTTVSIGAGPVIGLLNCRPWLHVNAVGSDFPGKTELSREFLERSFVCPDFLSQTLIEGECQQISKEHIGPSIVDIAKSTARYAAVKHQTSVFDSTGYALEDYVAMELALEFAAEFGLGRRVSIECLPPDPSNPYSFLSARINQELNEKIRAAASNSID